MKNLSLRNYPPSLLVIIICLIITLNWLAHVLIQHQPLNTWQSVALIIAGNSIVLAILGFINRYAMWGWYLKLLELHDVKGIYTGKLISSYHINDDPNATPIEMFCRLEIAQNINQLKVQGNFYSDEGMTSRTSGFTSDWEEIKKNDNNTFTIRYFFSNKGNQLHVYHSRYGLTNHDGICVLTYNPSDKTLSGYYFTHERSSHGELFLTRKV